MREYDSIVHSTLCIPASKVPEALQALKDEIEGEEPEKTYDGLLPLLRERFAWDGVVQSDGAVTNLCPIEKERGAHEDWATLLERLAPFLEEGCFLEFTVPTDPYALASEPVLLHYIVRGGKLDLEQLVTKWQKVGVYEG